MTTIICLRGQVIYFRVVQIITILIKFRKGSQIAIFCEVILTQIIKL